MWSIALGKGEGVWQFTCGSLAIKSLAMASSLRTIANKIADFFGPLFEVQHGGCKECGKGYGFTDHHFCSTRCANNFWISKRRESGIIIHLTTMSIPE